MSLGKAMLSLMWGVRQTIDSKVCGVAGEILTQWLWGQWEDLCRESSETCD